jgi:hypothetical protein
MGIGNDYPAGQGIAGGPALTARDRNAPPVPTAARFDPATKTFPFNELGQLEQEHPVDQAMVIACTFVRGRLKSAPATGNGLPARGRVHPAQLEHVARDEMSIATRRLVQNGDVQLLSVTATSAVAGRVMVEVAYVNLRTGAEQTVRR